MNIHDRYVNVGNAGGTYFDLVVTNRSEYRPYNASENRINGRFAQINFAANTRVDLRVTVYESCCKYKNCLECEAIPDSQAVEKAQCYASGCCCFSSVALTGYVAWCPLFALQNRRQSFGVFPTDQRAVSDHCERPKC